MTDFSEEACTFQDKLVQTLLANFAKKSGTDQSLLEINKNSVRIAKQDARSMTLADNFVDILIDKVLGGGFCFKVKY